MEKMYVIIDIDDGNIINNEIYYSLSVAIGEAKIYAEAQDFIDIVRAAES